jgi:hypothetical protein
MGFWISAVIALILAGLASPAVAERFEMGLPEPDILLLLAAAFAVAGFITRGKRGNRVTD